MGDPQVGEHLGANAVLPGIHRQALLEVRVDGVQALVLQPVGPQLVADADAAPLVTPQVGDDPDALGADLGQCSIQLRAAVTPQRAQQIAGEALGVDPHQRGIHGSQVAEHVGHVLLVVEERHVGVCGELAVLRRDARRTEVLDQLLVPTPVSDQVGDGHEVQVVLDGEGLQVGHPGHGPVVVHDLAQDTDRLTVGQGAEVYGGLRVAGPLEHAACTGPQRKDVARPGELGPTPAAVGQRHHGGRPVRGRDSRGGALGQVDRHREGGPHRLGVVHHHERQVQCIGPLIGHRGTDHATGVADHEGHLLRRHGVGGDDQVALVLTILVVDHDQELTPGVGLDGVFDGGQRHQPPPSWFKGWLAGRSAGWFKDWLVGPPDDWSVGPSGGWSAGPSSAG